MWIGNPVMSGASGGAQGLSGWERAPKVQRKKRPTKWVFFSGLIFHIYNKYLMFGNMCFFVKVFFNKYSLYKNVQKKVLENQKLKYLTQRKLSALHISFK